MITLLGITVRPRLLKKGNAYKQETIKQIKKVGVSKNRAIP